MTEPEHTGMDSQVAQWMLDWTDKAVGCARNEDTDALASVLNEVVAAEQLARLLGLWAQLAVEFTAHELDSPDEDMLREKGIGVAAMSLHICDLRAEPKNPDADPDGDEPSPIERALCELLVSTHNTDYSPRPDEIADRLISDEWPILLSVAASLTHTLSEVFPDHCTPSVALTALSLLKNARDGQEWDKGTLTGLAWLCVDLHGTDPERAVAALSGVFADDPDGLTGTLTGPETVLVRLSAALAMALGAAVETHVVENEFGPTGEEITPLEAVADSRPEVRASGLAALLHQAMLDEPPLGGPGVKSRALLAEINDECLHSTVGFTLAYWLGHAALRRVS